jgi:hypothetical protein
MPSHLRADCESQRTGLVRSKLIEVDGEIGRCRIIGRIRTRCREGASYGRGGWRWICRLLVSKLWVRDEAGRRLTWTIRSSRLRWGYRPSQVGRRRFGLWRDHELIRRRLGTSSLRQENDSDEHDLSEE